MTLVHALGHLDHESDYTVNLLDRLRALFMEDETLGSDTEFSYSWKGGYETVTVRRANGGGSEYRGSYHPGAVCETGTTSDTGVCIRCGGTLM